MKPTTRDDARREIEALLGPDGSPELAEDVLGTLHAGGVSWADAPEAARAMDEAEWNAVLDTAEGPRSTQAQDATEDLLIFNAAGSLAVEVSQDGSVALDLVDATDATFLRLSAKHARLLRDFLNLHVEGAK